MPRRRTRPEDALRGKIIEVLKSEGKRVIDNCSPIEHGADVLFLDKTYFGLTELAGIQIKIGNLTARSPEHPPRKITELIGQVMVALHKPWTIDGNGYTIGKFYILIDGELNHFARQYIETLQARFKQIQLIEKQHLEQFFTEKNAKLSRFSSGESHR